MEDIKVEIEKLRLERYFKDMNNVYKKLEKVVQDEVDTSLEQFLIDYFEIKKIFDKHFKS